jgi:release factor glutamine methyltransferase
MGTVEQLRAAGCVFAEEEAALLLGAAASGPELAELVRRRCAGLPLEPLLGWVEFRGRRLEVGPGVFVPRRRTEFLAELADAACAAGGSPAVLLELCCGVGPVVATCGPVTAYAVELDPVAADYARSNAPQAGVLIGDLFTPLPPALRGTITVIAANAPYVPSAEVAMMPREAREHEPLATHDGGPDGLDLHRRIAARAPMWLAPGGMLLIETSRAQAGGTATAMQHAGLRTEIETDDDRAATVVIGTLN